jgi:hypothetical protein
MAMVVRSLTTSSRTRPSVGTPLPVAGDRCGEAKGAHLNALHCSRSVSKTDHVLTAIAAALVASGGDSSIYMVLLSAPLGCARSWGSAADLYIFHEQGQEKNALN